MKTAATLTALVLAMAIPAVPRAAEPSGSNAPAKTSKPAKSKAGGSADAKRGGADTREKPGSADAKSAAAPKATDIRDTAKKKSVFLFAVDSCQVPSRCDKLLLDDSEKGFVAACEACASPQKCEEDRAAIRAGTSKSSYNPCK